MLPRDISIGHPNVVWKVCPMIVSEVFREDPNSKWGGMPQDSPSRHAPLHVRKHAFTSYYHPSTILSLPPPQTQNPV